MVSLLYLDVAGAFDNVLYERLIHNMRKRRVLSGLLKWVRDFLRERRITLITASYTTDERAINIGIPQRSPLLLILYLFYNADLLELCENDRFRISVTGFIDNVNILTYSTSTEGNCDKLRRIYIVCEDWARRHRSKFSAKKYELIHFTRTPKRFNMTASVDLGNDNVVITGYMRVLSVQLNTKLR